MALSQSRYLFTRLATDPATGKGILLYREPLSYRDRPDTRLYPVVQGDTLESIAHAAYQGLVERPELLWWVLAEFQPDPILDTSIALSPGRILYVPDPSVFLGGPLLDTHATETLR